MNRSAVQDRVLEEFDNYLEMMPPQLSAFAQNEAIVFFAKAAFIAGYGVGHSHGLGDAGRLVELLAKESGAA